MLAGLAVIEDPLRNFLPSIGPLVTYREPEQQSSDLTVRIDTGVFEGGVISMYYDPMISKLCTHASNRIDAINAMEGALDNYVVNGMGNNIPFLRAVYRNKEFRSGNYNTKFIPEQWPDGFKGVVLSPPETLRFVAMAVALHLERTDIVGRGNTNNYDYDEDDLEGNNYTHDLAEEELVVLIDGETYSVSLELDDALIMEITPKSTGKSKRVLVSSVDWRAGEPLAYASISTGSGNRSSKEGASGGEEDQSVAQFEGRTAEGFRMRMYGSQHEVVIRTPLEHKLSTHMLPAEVVDVSRYLLCPMPGTLVSCSVQAGQRVEAGQQLAVVEAMKMQVS